jgi:beta-phosphoglucomutase family hydrolase
VPSVTLRTAEWAASSPVVAVIFDLDGVVTDTAEVHAAAWKVLFDQFLAARPARADEDHRPFTRDDYLRFVDGRARHDGVAGFLGSRRIELEVGDPDDDGDAGTVHGLGNAKNRIFLDALAGQGVPVFPTTVAFVSQLRRCGVQTAVVSASENCAAVLDAGGVAPLFDARVDGVDARSMGLAGKPDPALFLEAAARLGVAPGDSAVVEDAIAGVEAGRAGGFAVVIGVDRSGDGRALRESGADVVLADLGLIDVAAEPADARGTSGPEGQR